MWPSRHHLNCAGGLPPEFFFVAPASSFHHHADPSAAVNFDPHPSNAAIGVIPLLTAAPLPDDDLMTGARGRASAAMHLWQNANLLQPGPSAGRPSGGGGSSSGGTTTCQDCGNQAKKDCSHRRCRTCCKSRGYDCSTHVKSTWVPAARRRERQLMGVSAAPGSSQSTSGTKKPRLGGAAASQTTSHTSTSNNTPTRSLETSNSNHHQDASLKDELPGQVRAPAVFKCVRVTAVDDGEDEYAYQALVRIGGHVFKGFLYDQGVQGREALPNLSELHLDGRRSSPPVVNLDPSSDQMYPGSGGGLLGGSSYVNSIN